MNPVTWALGATLVSRMLSAYKKKKKGYESRIEISGGEMSKFLITFFLMYGWMWFWIKVIESV